MARVWLQFAFILFGCTLATGQSCYNTSLPINSLIGNISFVSRFVSDDLCFYVEPRDGLAVGTQPKSINITVGPYTVLSDELIIYNNYFPNKNKVLWASKNANSSDSVSLDPKFPVFYVYYRSTGAGLRTFSISWAASADVERVLSLGLFVGVSVAVLLVIVVACVIKVSLRRRLLRRALRSKRLQQRINTTPPRPEQIIVWSIVGVGVLLFILFTSRAFKF